MTHSFATVSSLKGYDIISSIFVGEAQKIQNGCIESMTKAYLPEAYRPAAKIGANIVFKVYASNWLLWNQGIDTIIQLKERFKI